MQNRKIVPPAPKQRVAFGVSAGWTHKRMFIGRGGTILAPSDGRTGAASLCKDAFAKYQNNNTYYPYDTKLDNPLDGVYTWTNPNANKKNPNSNVRYTEGPKTKAWMDQREKNYLARIEREKQAKAAEEKAKVEAAAKAKEVEKAKVKSADAKQVPVVSSLISPQASSVPEEKSRNTLRVIAYDQLQLGEVLGQGSYGIVYQATWHSSKVAVKKLLNQKPSADTLEEFKTEAHIMVKLTSPNVVQIYGYCENPYYCLVMEYMPKGSLYNVLHSKENLSWDIRLKIITDIACGLAFLHHENILHRDIKSLNVLLNNQLDAKLTDFGLSKVKQETKTTTKTSSSVGTVQWMAPELFIRGGKYNQKSDVYSLGITFWEIAARRRPFDDAENTDVIPRWVQDGERPGDKVKEDDTDLKLKDCPKKIASLIRFCWQGNPDKRPGAANIVKYLKSKSEDFANFDPQASSTNTAQTEVKASSNPMPTSAQSSSSSTPHYRSNLLSEQVTPSLRK